jgi:endoribonuclease Dicer
MIFLLLLLCLLGDENLLDSGPDYLKAVDLGYVSPKLHELLQVFQSFG